MKVDGYFDSQMFPWGQMAPFKAGCPGRGEGGGGKGGRKGTSLMTKTHLILNKWEKQRFFSIITHEEFAVYRTMKDGLHHCCSHPPGNNLPGKKADSPSKQNKGRDVPPGAGSFSPTPSLLS